LLRDDGDTSNAAPERTPWQADPARLSGEHDAHMVRREQLLSLHSKRCPDDSPRSSSL